LLENLLKGATERPQTRDATERNAASAHETPEQPPGADSEREYFIFRTLGSNLRTQPSAFHSTTSIGIESYSHRWSRHGHYTERA